MPESKPHSELPPVSREALEANLRSTHANLDFCIEQRQRLEEQLETLQAEYRDFVNEISFPTFEDSRIEWVEVQIDKDVLAGARSRTASFPAMRQREHELDMYAEASNQDTDPAKSQEDE